MQPLEISVAEAIAQAPLEVGQLTAMAQRHRASHTEVDRCETRREWVSGAGTYCYQTHIAISAQPQARLAWLADVFYRAANLRAQPWYPQFSGGASAQLSAAPASGIAQHQLCIGRFDLGLGEPRYYRQLVSLAHPAPDTQVIVARSVPDGPHVPQRAKLAYTLNPNGEVFYREADRLHWHHICCTPGAALLPHVLDTVLINLLRRFGMDAAERRTYQEEAERLQRWLQSAPGVERLEESLDWT